MELLKPSTWFPAKTNKAPNQRREADFPDKVYIQREGEYNEYSSENPELLRQRLDELIHGEYSTQNFIELFYCLPEIFAPIHEIASRVADANWQLKKSWNDEVDYKDYDYNRLFTQPNPLMSHRDLVYMSVCYEILTGKTLWHFNIANLLSSPELYKKFITWWVLPSGRTTADLKRNVDPYVMTELKDFVNFWKMPLNGGNKKFDVESVLPLVHLNLRDGTNLNNVKGQLSGAAKAIKNLIPVYEARGIIYIKRGALGFLVSAKKDADGTKALTDIEKKALRKEANKNYGLQANKDTVGITDQPVDFIKTSMSIAEMLPFDETLADAAAIYACLRVPPHLIPSKDKSTFNNADADMKAFYDNVIIPWAKRYALEWTNYFKFDRRYIFPDYSHIKVLQENEKEKSASDKVKGDIWMQRWENGACSLNEWIVANDGTKGVGTFYEKKLFEMTQQELDFVKVVMSVKTKSNGNTNQAGQNESGAQVKGASN